MNAPDAVKMNGLAAALVRAQKGFAPALKSSINPHFKSKYVDLSGCVEAVIDSLNDNGIALVQQTHECESGVMVETIFLHESGESFSCGKLHVPASKNDAQGYGSALTYARRYSLMAACGIAPEDDDGNAASKKQYPAKEVPEPTATDIDAAIATLRGAAENGATAFKKAVEGIPDAIKAMITPSIKKDMLARAKEIDSSEVGA